MEQVLEKLSALVPLPRVHLVRYAGCLAAHSQLRGALIPTPHQRGVDGNDASTGTPLWNWPRLLKRVFAVDMAMCLWCRGGALSIMATVTHEAVSPRLRRACGGGVLRGRAPRACAIPFASVPPQRSPSTPSRVASSGSYPTPSCGACPAPARAARCRPSLCAGALRSVLPPGARCACTPWARSVRGGWRRGAPGGTLPRMLAPKAKTTGPVQHATLGPRE